MKDFLVAQFIDSFQHIVKMYTIFDTQIMCDMALPELAETNQGTPGFRVQLGTMDQRSLRNTEWHFDWTNDDGTSYLRFGYLGDLHMICFPKLADFSVSLNERKICYYPNSNIPEESIRHLLIDQVIPRSLGQLGKLVLHASAVKLPNGKGIAFLGESGWGKSTLASSFLAQDSSVVSDDCVLIEQRNGKLVATASYSGLRLFDDSATAIFNNQFATKPVAHYSTKRRHLPPQTSIPQSLELDSIFVLGNPADIQQDQSISIEPILGTDSLMALVRQLFLLDPLDKRIIAKTFEALGACLQGGIPVYRLDCPHNHSLLKEVHSAITGLMSDSVAT